MQTTTNAGAGLKKAIKGSKEERVSVNYLQGALLHQQEQTPLDYREVLGELLAPLIGSNNVMTVEEAITDITATLVEVLSDKSCLMAAGSSSFTKSLSAVLMFLNRLNRLAPTEGPDANDHLFIISNLWLVERWQYLTPKAKEEQLDMYGTDEVWRR